MTKNKILFDDTLNIVDHVRISYNALSNEFREVHKNKLDKKRLFVLFTVDI